MTEADNGIYAKILADSCYDDVRLISLETKAPKFLDAECCKHRMINANSSSDRAIPSKKLVGSVFLPTDLRLNQPGMQGAVKASPDDVTGYHIDYSRLHRYAVQFTEANNHIHKQHINRALLPFSFQYKVMTATYDQWLYFLNLRLHDDADPAIYELAHCIATEIESHNPDYLSVGQWHLPYITDEDSGLDIKDKVKCSVARCARTSYKNHDGTKCEVEKDIGLFNMLVGNNPPHMSPTDHQATPMSRDATLSTVGVSHMTRDNVLYSGNLRGWIQLRKLIEQGFF